MKNQLLSLVTAFTLLLFPFLNFAQAPSLGAAANFVLFSTSGAIGNSGTTYLTRLKGDVGTNSGAITGFGNVNGVMHSPDTATSKAANDLLIAYNQLNTTPSTLSHSPVLGNGDSLNAGVYAIAGNTTLNLDLVLNARGNANAVFIFKISGTFSTSNAAEVKLVNGSMACNVFWKVEGAVNLAADTKMKGTIIANNAAIDLATGVILEGRALSTTGAVAVSQVLAYTPVGCGSLRLTGPAAPNLKAAACFAILTGNGSVINSGTSRVTGDIGTNAGLTVGYDPLYVTGYIHPVPDVFTAAAAADLLPVYSYLDSLPADIELLFPAQFGRNLILTPHTYIMNGATTFTDSLYLDGEGNYNAVFLIKIKGALSTTTLAKVYLINGAQAKNVYWVIDGAVAVNDNSVFNGTIICNNGAIDLTTGVTLNGRALTTGGALSTASVVATSPSGNCNLLPVSWIYFRGKPVKENALLEWGTTKEINNGFFTIEKSRNGNTFELLTKVKAAEENGKTEHHYSFKDPEPYNLSYYRISQTDKDGQRNFYRTIKVKVDINQRLKIINYVQEKVVYVQVSGALPANGLLELYSIDGKKVASKKIILTREVSRYKIEKPLEKGIYLIHIISRGDRLYRSKVMVL